MIQLKRQRTTAAIPAAFRGPGKIASERRLLVAKRAHMTALATNPNAAHGFKSTWWKNAKPSLRDESVGKCAYCEGRADVTAHSDVEHIRPKDTWWWLTVCWDNYCYACQLCNQTFKSNNFPVALPMIAPGLLAASTEPQLAQLAGTLAPDPLDANAVAQYRQRLVAENAELPDPYFDDPETLLAWEVDDLTQRVKVVARTGANAQRAVAACIEYFGLNRDDLCDFRYDTYDSIAVLKETLETPGISADRKKDLRRRLGRHLAPRHAFAGMCRYFVCDVWQLLPRPT